MKIQLNRHILIKILLVSVIMLISISYSIKIFDNIDQKKTSSYEVSEFKYQTYMVQKDTVQTYFIPCDNKVLKYIVTLDNIPNITGNIGYEVYDNKEQKKILTSGIVDMKSVKEINGIGIDLSNSKLEKNKNYKIVFYFALDGKMGLRVKSDGNLSDRQLIEFTHGNIYKSIICYLNVALLVTLIFILYKPNINKSFLILALTTGLLGIIIIPPYTAPDELRHFARAYDITNGNIMTNNFKTSEEFYNMTFPICKLPIELHNMKLLSENSGNGFEAETNNKIVISKWIDMFESKFTGNTVITPIQGTSSISPMAYLPQILFIFIAKLFNMIPIMVLYMARLGNVVFSGIMGYYSLKLIPRYKNIILFLYFTPGLIFLRSTSSTDGLLFSLIILLIAYILALRNKESSVLGIKKIIFITFLLSWIALIKLPYILCAFLLVICDKTFDEKIKFKVMVKNIAIVIGIIVISILFYRISTGFLNRKHLESVVHGKDYIIYLFKHPIKVGNMILQSFLNDTFNYFTSAIQFPTSNNLNGIYIVSLFFVSIFSFNDLLNKYKKVFIVLLSCFMWFSVLFIFYFLGPQPDLGYIWGIQGRYILPIVVLACLALPLERDSIKEEIISKYIGTIILNISIIHFMQIFSNYYI